MRYFFLLFIGLGLLASCGSDGNDDSKSSITKYDGYTLMWSDEFEGSTLDPSHWVHETGDGTDYGLAVGWGNNEKQIYKDDITTVSIQEDDGNSVLAITAFKTGPGSYVSGKITTRGLHSVRYGKVEASIKLPEGKGLWPAFWALGDNFMDPIDWPGCGEIDIMEMLGDNTSKMYSTIHYTNEENKHGETQGIHELTSGTLSDSYHTFTLDWTPEVLEFSVDDVMIKQIPIEADMKEYQRSFYLILNLAVGGNWPGSPDETTIFPQSLLVDYVRVYENDNLQVSDPPILDLVEESLGLFVDPSISVHAISDDFTEFGDISVNAYGGGGEPGVVADDESVDGDKSLKLSYPGGNWGGAFFELDQDKDFSGYAGGNLVFSLKYPESFMDAELKLESPGQATFAAVFLVDYTPTDIGGGWVTYTVPMADFVGLDLTQLKIPFALWNPMDQTGTEFFVGDILVDDIHLTQ